MLNCGNIKTAAAGRAVREIIYIESLDSTNRLAMELGDKGALHGTVVIAGSQTKGRGRLGRRWESPAGVNIYMSVILRPDLEPKDATLLTVLSSVASARAIRGETGLNAEIKWPNDLMCRDKKLGGILTELRLISGKILFAVTGIGINVNAAGDDFPPELSATATSVMIETAAKQDINKIIPSVLNKLDDCYNNLLQKGTRPLLDEWRSLSSTLGRHVRVTTGSGIYTGIAQDIDDKGMLILRLSSGELRKVSEGDLNILR